jgi:hypothetical protein
MGMILFIWVFVFVCLERMVQTGTLPLCLPWPECSKTCAKVRKKSDTGNASCHAYGLRLAIIGIARAFAAMTTWWNVATALALACKNKCAPQLWGAP